MKTKLSTLLIILTLAASAADKYADQMTTNITLVYKAQTTEELLQAVNAFERIGNAEKTKWEPYYYAAFGTIMLATRETDGGKKDLYLDQAASLLVKASAINGSESEIVTLEGFIHTIRLTVDPATRGQQYSMLSMQSFGKALALNPNNPRAMSLMAQMQFGTAKFFNQKPTEACETALKALSMFDNYKTENALAPSWGKEMTAGLVKQCQ